LGQHRATQRHAGRSRPDTEPLRRAIIALATQYGRYGYRRITALLRQAGWVVNAKRVARIWRLEGLKVPPRQPKRGRLWLTDGSCVRLRPTHPNHVWAYDFMTDRTHDGKTFRLLTVLDELTREGLAIVVARRFFDHWKDSLQGQDLAPFEKFAAMVERNWDGITAYGRAEEKVSLGFVEGLNTKIRVIQRRTYGLRDEEYLRLKILTCMLSEI
jgi:hypothetical protein